MQCVSWRYELNFQKKDFSHTFCHVQLLLWYCIWFKFQLKNLHKMGDLHKNVEILYTEFDFSFLKEAKDLNFYAVRICTKKVFSLALYWYLFISWKPKFQEDTFYNKICLQKLYSKCLKCLMPVKYSKCTWEDLRWQITRFSLLSKQS